MAMKVITFESYVCNLLHLSEDKLSYYIEVNKINQLLHSYYYVYMEQEFVEYIEKWL